MFAFQMVCLKEEKIKYGQKNYKDYIKFKGTKQLSPTFFPSIHLVSTVLFFFPLQMNEHNNEILV